jgi:predicted dehydrogenase
VKQVLQDRNGGTVVRDVPAPPCPVGSVLVANAYSVISSGTERSRVELSQKSLLGKARDRPDLVREVIARGRREGIRATGAAVRRKLAEETPIGYSSAGIVLEVGESTHGFDPGDRVACAGGGHATHSEIVSIPANLCATVPDSVPLESAAMTTLAAIALHGVRLADVRIGDRVAVIGCGLVGQIACRLLHAAGAEIFALDIDRDRVDQALAGGAQQGFVVAADVHERVLAATRGKGVDEVIITAAAATNDPLLLASLLARDRGAVVLVGDVPIAFPRASLYDKELSFRVSRSYGPGRYDLEYEERGLDYPIGYIRWTEKRNMEAVLELQGRGALRLGDLIEKIIPVEEAEQAYALLTGPPENRPRGALILSFGIVKDAPSELPAPALLESRSPLPAHPRRSTPRPVRIGLVGPGSFATRVLVPALVRAGARLELVGGGAGRSAEAAARNLGFARVATDGEAVVDDPSVDAVVISTRHASHATLTQRALRAGKHVFCEKPLALTLQELDDVLEAAEQSPGILAVGFNRRYSPLLRELREFVADGSHVVATYRVNAGAIPPDHWVHDLSQGGGRALGELCHFVDSLAFVSSSAVRSVFAVGYGSPDLALQARDNLVVSLEFADGSVGSIVYAADGSVRLPKERLEVFSGVTAAVLDDYRSLDLLCPTGRTKRKNRAQDKGHRQEIEAFVDGAVGGEEPVRLDVIANVTLATLAVVESLRTARVVRLS